MNTFSIADIQVILLYVSDLDRSRRFYGDLLGLPFVGEIPDRLLEYSVGSIHLLLHRISQEEQTAKHTPVRSIELYFGVKDVKAAIEALRAAGVKILEEPALQPWGKIDAAVMDPDGYCLHLSSEPIAEPAGMAADFRPAA